LNVVLRSNLLSRDDSGENIEDLHNG